MSIARRFNAGMMEANAQVPKGRLKVIPKLARSESRLQAARLAKFRRFGLVERLAG